MNTALAEPKAQQRALVSDQAQAVMRGIDTAIAQTGNPLAQGVAGKFERALSMSALIKHIRAELTDAVMAENIMPLMNTRLGFRTDRDPNQIDKKTGRPYVPYPIDVARECLIVAVLLGVCPIGNEFNIIAGNCYITKEGFSRLLKELPGLTDLKPCLGVPRNASGGAIVDASATWKVDGKSDSIERQIPVKVNDFMGIDGVLGKATRKLYCAIYNQITGSELSDGDVGDEVPMAVLPGGAKSLPASEGNAEPKSDLNTEMAAAAEEGNSSASAKPAKKSPPKKSPPKKAAQAEPKGEPESPNADEGAPQAMDGPSGGEEDPDDPMVICRKAAERLAEKAKITIDEAKRRIVSYIPKKFPGEAIDTIDMQQAHAIGSDVKVVVDPETIK